MRYTPEDAAARYARSLARLAFTYTGNTADAEDVVQEVFIAYLEKRPHFTSDEHEKAWLLRVTINRSLNFVRKRKNHACAALDENVGYLPEPQREVLASVLALPERYRTVIHLHYFEGYSIKEIAGLLSRKEATVGTWLARGRRLMKGRLET